MTASAQPDPTDPTGSTTDPGARSVASVAPSTPQRPGGRPPSPGLVTVTGVITPGVEPGCLMLNEYQLIGGPAELLQAGTKVTVSGRAEPDLVTTCMQGIPLRVENAKRS